MPLPARGAQRQRAPPAHRLRHHAISQARQQGAAHKDCGKARTLSQTPPPEAKAGCLRSPASTVNRREEAHVCRSQVPLRLALLLPKRRPHFLEGERTPRNRTSFPRPSCPLKGSNLEAEGWCLWSSFGNWSCLSQLGLLKTFLGLTPEQGDTRRHLGQPLVPPSVSRL